MFYELDPPYRAITSPKFYISSVDAIPDKFMFLRNDGNGVDDGSGKFNLYLFETMLDAHEAAETYYARHKMYYPYSLALNTFRHEAQIGTVPKVETNGSQVMEFI